MVLVLRNRLNTHQKWLIFLIQPRELQGNENVVAKRKSNYEHRRDNRTDAEFAHDMKYAHKNEALLMQAYIDLKRKTYSDIKYENNGADNSGRVIFDAKQTSKKADFKVFLNNKEYLVEVKNCPVSYKVSFKAEDLDTYYERGPDNLSILTFVGTDLWRQNNKRPSPKTKFFRVLKKDIPLLKQLSTYNKNENGKSFGGKPIYILKERHFNRFIGPESLY